MPAVVLPFPDAQERERRRKAKDPGHRHELVAKPATDGLHWVKTCKVCEQVVEVGSLPREG